MVAPSASEASCLWSLSVLPSSFILRCLCHELSTGGRAGQTLVPWSVRSSRNKAAMGPASQKVPAHTHGPRVVHSCPFHSQSVAAWTMNMVTRSVGGGVVEQREGVSGTPRGRQGRRVLLVSFECAGPEKPKGILGQDWSPEEAMSCPRESPRVPRL